MKVSKKEVGIALRAARESKGSAGFRDIVAYLETHLNYLQSSTGDVPDKLLVAHKHSIKLLDELVKNLNSESRIIKPQEDGAYFHAPAPEGETGTH